MPGHGALSAGPPDPDHTAFIGPNPTTPQEAEAARSRAVRLEASARRRSAKLGVRKAAVQTGESQIQRREEVGAQQSGRECGVGWVRVLLCAASGRVVC
jgi:hypothetical protein